MSAPSPHLNTAGSRVLSLLDGPSPSTCRSEPIDFHEASLDEYSGCFALWIHDLLTPEECAELLRAAQETTGGQWQQALVNGGLAGQILALDTRNCGRIIWDTEEIADRLQERILPHLPPDIVTLKNKPIVTGTAPVRKKQVWQLTRLNERLRFLKYTRGMYFRSHCDGSYVTADETEVSWLTVHLYLNGDNPALDGRSVGDSQGKITNEDLPLKGGATRFFGWEEDVYLDVSPQTGGCLVFQHRDMLHSGEEVVQGTKLTMRTDILYRLVEDHGS